MTEKKPSSEMFSTSDVVDFKSGVVFETATPDIKNSADAVTIRQCVADAMIKAAAESESSKKYLAAPSVDDIERSVRSHVKKYLDMNMFNQNANSELSVENTVRKIIAEQQTRSTQVAASANVPALSRDNIEMAVRKAVSEHMPRTAISASIPRSVDTPVSPSRVLSRDVVENAVRTALLKHMPMSPEPQQANPDYDRIELAVRQAISKNLGLMSPASASSATSVSRNSQMRDLLY